MHPKRKLEEAALSARKEPRLISEDPKPIREIDPDGDLYLAVKETNAADSDDPVVYLVDRKILCLSSPVFKAMLGRDSRFLEGSSNLSTKFPEVTVEDESAEAVGIILLAIHIQGHRVPQTVSYHMLQYLATVCDKYDLRSSLGAWPEMWVKDHAENMDQARNEALFIAYAFKLDAAFAKITRRLILSSRIAGNDTVVNIFGQVIGGYTPGVVLDQIKSARMEAIVAIERRLWKLQDPIQKVETACRHFDADEAVDDDDNRGPGFCQLLQSGILRRKLFYLEHPHSESPFRKRSLDCILFDLEDVKNTRPRALKYHQSCLKGPGMYTYASKRIEEIKGLSFDKPWNISQQSPSMHVG